MALPPGVVYVGSRFPRVVVLPPAVIFLSIHLARSLYGVVLPVWLTALAYLLSWPVATVISVQARDRRIAREAAAAGAVLPPCVKTEKFAGWDIIRDIGADAESRILGYRQWIWYQQCGSIANFRALFENRYFTVEPEYVKRILATEFDNYEKGPRFRFQLKSLLGTGVFNSDGDMWKFHRAMTRPFFSKDRITHFDIFDRHADDVLRLVKERMEQGFPVDWQDLVGRFTLDSATEFLFGQNVHSLSAPLPYPPTSPLSNSPEAIQAQSLPANLFAHAFLEAQVLSGRRSRYGSMWPLWEIWKDEVAAHMKTVDAFIEPLCREAVRKRAEKAKNGLDNDKGEEDDETLLDYLVKLTDDHKVIRDETLNILLAGRDTTASTLTMAIYRLAMHPDILGRLREEIHEKVGTRRPTYDDIKNMKYLRAFINEVLRLYPSVPFNVRDTINATTWPSMIPGEKPIYVPAGTICLYSVYLMHRRKDLWGPDADKFDPDRFIDERLHRYLTPNPFIFVPFNAGPRICLGQQFAYNQVSFLLTRLLQRVSSITLIQEVDPKAALPSGFHGPSSLSDGSDKLFFKGHLTMYVQSGVWVKMEEEPLDK